MDKTNLWKMIVARLDGCVDVEVLREPYAVRVSFDGAKHVLRLER